MFIMTYNTNLRVFEFYMKQFKSTFLFISPEIIYLQVKLCGQKLNLDNDVIAMKVAGSSTVIGFIRRRGLPIILHSSI